MEIFNQKIRSEELLIHPRAVECILAERRLSAMGPPSIPEARPCSIAKPPHLRS